MSCTICGRSTLPGAKLCIQCKKALKRARQETVSELDPPPRRVPAATRRSLPENSGGVEGRSVRVRLGGRASPSRMGLPASLVALGIVVVTTGYFVSHLRGAGDARIRPPRTSPPAAASAYRGRLTYRCRASSAAEPRSRACRRCGPGMVARRRPRCTTAPAKPAQAARARDPPAAADPSIARFACDAADRPAIAAATGAGAGAGTGSADRWQLLSEAIARCAGEGVLRGRDLRAACTLAVLRRQMGRVAQCPGAIGGDFHR